MTRWALLLGVLLALLITADGASASHNTNAGNQGQPYRLPWTWDLHGRSGNGEDRV